ncbi:non-hydrolyzing UDP-N-acetylglucosamine 2-epimerase [Chryseobacterium sp.]|uniref:non-hydrolyzing UDP-N-acetylglucosamine 2-epimerase n=1 Tax=Chryseobacterium sp. TaxID=1871047 RepID=UPI00289AEA62|nr:UDP-N-acetylglucosamine 2-epimerase (non-hydrolyzing) [Chryseobacterium sp.]
MKILTIIGARPQFVKAAVISRIIAEQENIKEVLVHTGQHYDKNMSDVFFEDMNIPQPDYNLHIQSKFHGEMTGKMMGEIEKVALKENPDWILVYGDTNSTLAGALVAAKLHIKLAHIEAGLRSFNNKMPEEVNRILTDRISNILFCPTENAMNNLKNEGFERLSDKKIIKTGDIMLDASNYYMSKSNKPEVEMPSDFNLCTIHRADNTDDPQKLSIIFDSLNEIGNETKIVLPIHPRTKSLLSQLNPDYEKDYSNILFCEPFGYFEMIWCLQNAKIIITDSGGLQKEAYFFKKPCLTLRDQTEWTELVDYGYNILSKIDKKNILENYHHIKTIKKDFNDQLYGDGKTGELILKELQNY